MASKWLCAVCDYTYDPEQGDPEAHIPPGTPFEELPEDWLCPDCGARRLSFDRIE
ncbi:MAG: rubredoxin [Magnetococcus sp. MYC-9]